MAIGKKNIAFHSSQSHSDFPPTALICKGCTKRALCRDAAHITRVQGNRVQDNIAPYKYKHDNEGNEIKKSALSHNKLHHVFRTMSLKHAHKGETVG